MDSNVSKNTNSHKFFKVPLEREKPIISVKKLLKQLLLSTLSLYRQKFDVRIEPRSIATMLESKIILAKPNSKPLSLKTNTIGISSNSKLVPIEYSCPLNLLLASSWQTSSQIVTDNLSQLLAERQNELTDRSRLQIYLELVSPGWVNFYFDSEFIAHWLERSRLGIGSDIGGDNKSTFVSSEPWNQIPVIFQIQYIHARCCSLLRLGERENLITLQKNLQYAGWQIEQPRSISWLDRENNLWFEEPAEHNLLRQLLTVTDCWDNSDGINWSKIALDLSQATAIFQADCRLLGKIKIQAPSKAIARLGLIAHVQYWLQKILLEKLQVAAPTTL